MDEVWLSDRAILMEIWDGLKNAEMANPKTGELIPDYRAKAQFANMLTRIKKWHKPDTVINILNAFGKSDVLY